MENRTNFNLKESIEIWKSELSKKSNMTTDNIEELESHLLDLINDLKSKGLDKEESFLIARKRIGKIDDICLEFDKVNNHFSFINKAIPYLKGALIYIAFIALSKLLLLYTLILTQKLSLNSTMFKVISAILLVSISISFFSVLYYHLKRGNSFLNKLNNIKILVLLIVLSSIITVRSDMSGAVKVMSGLNLATENDYFQGFFIMENNFLIYKILSVLILLTTSLIFYWKDEKYDKIKYTK
ncbi:permease prefix domain 1-containing protein [uncultured Wocania sp.]|uniref:permease prefix domain 1-containing protein n=1 Tax=uncultured Wocania sp. TaxID=2834404 RepID=UPI0030FA75D9